MALQDGTCGRIPGEAQQNDELALGGRISGAPGPLISEAIKQREGIYTLRTL